ncbi:hypothetical protein PSTG_00270 [Puccinia striiformis f. sp. tritici PST-78]|uniref:Methionyl/Valyl/Leucyl/Isoleucyl-tRNA synthetase anticodon-binding domain-containing protein n=1 Tax=Puccinia striiformis f. sp. tritici PST-78 TaxID=1165861 RepID=A0A0L0W4C1_9BASI|nr:hypothetical protein PSTG_00270 [Puccinia striiformis f. sp. tritici PST-78]
MLDLVDKLTNWYIRFNRRRLKGENGPEDAVIALNTLFETLFTLCCTSSFTPFLTKNIYQGLRSFFPKETQDLGHGDGLQSVHFLCDLTGSRYVDKELPSLNNSPSAPAYENNTDEDAVILLNCNLRPELESEGFTRELMNRIQRLRKKAGAVQTDELDVYYSFFEDLDPEPNQFFEHVLVTQAEPEVLCRVLRKVPEPDTLRDSYKPVLAQELQERWGDVGLAETRRSDSPLSSWLHELDVIGQVNTWLP